MNAVALAFRRLQFLTVVGAAVGACGTRNRTVSVDSATVDTTSQVTSPIPAQGDSVIALLETGCGGGVTGGGGGTFVTADGRFYRYQRSGPLPNAKEQPTFVRKDSLRAATLVQAAERAGITRIKYSVPSNVTCHLSLDRGGASYEVDWAMGTKPAAIEKLIGVAAELEAAAR